MDLFDMVRAAPPPQHIRDNELAENEQRSPSPVLPSPGHSTSMSPIVYPTSDLEEVNTGSLPAPDAATTADAADEVDTSTADAADEVDASTADAADEADASTADAADEADASTADEADKSTADAADEDASTADEADACTADAADEADATASASDEESTNNCKRLEVRVKRTISREYSVPRATSPAGSEKQYNLDDDNDLESHSQSQSPQQLQLQQCPPKTKAEQKMFVDALLPAQDNSFKLKNCVVRLKRLTPQDIAALQSAARSPKKRGRPRNSDSQNSDVSPPKKPLFKVHFRAPWLQNGGKSFARSPFKTPRSGTPPPARLYKLQKSPKLNSSPKAKERAALVKKYGPIYGSRCFNCVVKVKRAPMPFNSPRTPLNHLIGRARKSNLSVSFSDSVEILGSGSISRGRGKKLPKTPLSVPTRLQRVDAEGNVLEDIELPNHAGLKPTAKCKRRSLGNGCNGGSPNKTTTPGRRGRPSKLKRPAQPLPVTDLASLRIDDEDEDGEFIVPNDLPECHPISPRRAGTPIPSKRILTTTISDDEVETEPLVEKTPDRVASIGFDADDNDANKKEEQPGEHGQLKQVTNVQATESVKNSCLANDLPVEDNNKTDKDCQDIDKSAEKEVPGAVEVTERNVHNTINDTKGDDMSNNDNSNNKVLHEDDADTKTVANEAVAKELPAVVDELTSDILEIRTSIEDVRELHTPVSRESTPRKRMRRSLSANSDASFKSANDELDTKTDTETNGKIRRSDIENVGGLVKTSSTEREELNESGTYSTPNEANGSFTAQPHYSPLDVMPNLDDDALGELGRLVEPDFQLSASANTLPSGNLDDDIMTVLDS